jgi:hypothetical protein
METLNRRVFRLQQIDGSELGARQAAGARRRYSDIQSRGDGVTQRPPAAALQ